MEMHQIRYFLAVSQRLNFTRAAEECHVAQPSLTRAIKLLEEELGSDLFRRERKLTHLTDFGQRMLPFMRQCFDSAVSAKKLASTMKSGGITPLALALSNTIDMTLLAGPITELYRALHGLELRIVRGNAEAVVEALKEGDAELAVAGPLDGQWDRLDAWQLFSEPLSLVVSGDHKLANLPAVDVESLAGEKLLLRPYCETSEQFMRLLRTHGVSEGGHHQMVAEHDLIPLLQAGLGVGILPRSMPCPGDLRRLGIVGIDFTRNVQLYGVAGRQRSAAASTLMKLLRSHVWDATLH